MMNRFLVVLLISACVKCETLTCTDTEIGRVCAGNMGNRFRPWYMSLAKDGNLLFVGTSNFLHSFATDTLNLLQSVDLSPSDETFRQCKDQQLSDTYCVNSVTLIQQIPHVMMDNATAKYNDTILVCGTNALSPRCTVHDVANISDWFILSGEVDLGFSPYTTDWSNVGMLASTGNFYSATNFEVHTELTRLAVSLYPLSGDTSFAAASNDRDPFWVSETDFISIHELDDHMYIFGQEDSKEVTARDSSRPLEKFGRVIRICKSDQGLIDEVGRTPRFKTFQKIRITCPNEIDDSFPQFYYNDLQATYLHTDNEGSKWLYATFITRPNGPSGSAICKYSFDPDEANSLANVFSRVAEYYESDGQYTNVRSFEPFRCPGESGRERERVESTSFQLITNMILPTGGNAVHTVNGESYEHISVDVYRFNDMKYEVMFVATKSMSVRAICHKNEQPFFTHTLAEYDETIDNFILDNGNASSKAGIRKIYVSGESFVASIVLGNCGKYSNCKECLESNDPYCAWQVNGSQLCINKLVTNYNGQIFETSEVNANVCPPAPTISTTSTTNVQTTISTSKVKATTAQNTNSKNFVKSSEVGLTTTAAQCPMTQKTSTVTEYTTTTVPLVSAAPTIEPVSTQSSLTVQEMGELIGVGLGGLVLGLILGVLACFVMTWTRSKVNHKPAIHNDYPSSDPSMYQNVGTRHATATVEQYTITVTLPEKKTDEDNGNDYIQSPVPSSISPPIVDDSELEDDAISDLPSNGGPSLGGSHSKIKKWAVPKGRTPSTRWLRASESEGESPVSPS